MAVNWRERRSRYVKQVRLSTCLIVCCVVGCGGAKPPPQRASAAGPQLHQGPITDLVPAAGLRWMVVARPKELWSDATLRRGLEKLFPPERLDVFAQQSGIELRSLTTACVAGFDIGTLYLAETRDGVERAEQAFLGRLASEPVTKHPGPGVVHITGIIGLTPESFVGVKDRAVGVSVKDPTLTKIVAAFALERLKKSPTALAGAALHHLPTSLSVDPLQFYAPGPFAEEWSKAAGGLLGQSLGVGISAHIVAAGAVPAQLDVQVILVGEYGDDAPKTIQRALSTFQDLAQSGLGRVLSLRDETITPEILATPEQVRLHVRLPLEPLLDGVYAAVAANAAELLNYKSR